MKHFKLAMFESLLLIGSLARAKKKLVSFIPGQRMDKWDLSAFDKPNN